MRGNQHYSISSRKPMSMRRISFCHPRSHIKTFTNSRCWYGNSRGYRWFRSQLPHDLVSAFKSTLQETVEASLLLHVIDAADARKIENIEAVNLVLEEIKGDKVPVLLVYNKIDLLENMAPHIEYDDENKPVAVYLSAHSGEGLELLLEAIKVRLKNEILSFTPHVTSARRQNSPCALSIR